MCKDTSAKYCQDNKKGLQKASLEIAKKTLKIWARAI